MFFNLRKITVLWSVLLFSTMSLISQNTEESDFDPNFAHVVYFWFHDPDNIEDRALFEKGLQKFLEQSEYTKTNFVGIPPKAVRDVVDDSYTYNLIVTFESAEAQEKYQNEEVHLQFIEELKHLWKKVIVYDAIPLKK